MIVRRLNFRMIPAAVMLLATIGLWGAQSPDTKVSDLPVISLEATPALGDAKARVAIVEFGDYQCPFCGRHASQTLPQIVAAYVKTGKIRYFFKDVPIESIHPQAFKAAEAAHCAGAQGKYWKFHDRLFQNQKALSPADLVTHALAVELEAGKFDRCLNSEEFAVQIRTDLLEAKKQSIRGTPSFFLGTVDPNGRTFSVVMRLNGAVPFSSFQQALDQLLSLQTTSRQR